jgi:hypothetical protein
LGYHFFYFCFKWGSWTQDTFIKTFWDRYLISIYTSWGSILYSSIHWILSELLFGRVVFKSLSALNLNKLLKFFLILYKKFFAHTICFRIVSLVEFRYNNKIFPITRLLNFWRHLSSTFMFKRRHESNIFFFCQLW